MTSSPAWRAPAALAGRFLLFPLRMLLSLNLHLFWATYTLSGRVRARRRPKRDRNDDVESKLREVVRDLEERGVAKWEGMFQPEELRGANELMDRLMPRSRAAQRDAEPRPRAGAGARFDENIATVADPENPGWRHTWELVEKEFLAHYADGDPSRIYGRTRSICDVPPPSMDRFLRDARVAEIANRYLEAETAPQRLLLEEMTPSLMEDVWHVDCMGKAFRAIILVSDCGLDNAPLRYLAGSHRTSAPAKKRLYYNMLRYGYSFSTLSLFERRTLPGEVVFGTGKAGDCLFFDRAGVHSGSRCLSGRRRDIVLLRHAPTFRSVLLDCLGTVTH